MPKLLHLVIYKCLDCPYCERTEQNSNYCVAPNRYVKLSEPMGIPANCPLPETKETA
jgi:hypothetical protein